jgi:hypothetical protein
MDHFKPPAIGAAAPSTPSAKCDAGWVASRIEMVLAAYRRDDYADPLGFVTQLGVVLEKYPEWVVRHVTSPDTGIQRTSKFPPSIAEMVAACDELHGPELRRAERELQIKAQLAERRALPNWAKRAGHDTISYAQAEEMIKANPAVKIRGVFDSERTVPYRA